MGIGAADKFFSAFPDKLSKALKLIRTFCSADVRVRVFAIRKTCFEDGGWV
jgi:hypothetical protein